MVTGLKPLGGPSMKSRKKARKTTAEFHIIKNELSILDKKEGLSEPEKSIRKADLEQQLESIGGIDAYQKASIISTQHFKTSRWVLGQIDQHLNIDKSQNDPIGKMECKRAKDKLKVLEVGAINIQLQQSKHLDVRSIDINSQHPLIEEIDFFDVEPQRAYDVIVCSMVLNCVHEVSRRGEMLARLKGHLRNADSLLLLVLPLRCIRSKHLGDRKFDGLCLAMGLDTIEVKETPRLLFYTFRLSNPSIGRGEERSEDREIGCMSSVHWKEECRDALTSLRKDNPPLASHFEDHNYKSVPANEFCLSFSPEFLPVS